MHRITFIVTFASLLLLQSVSRAQDGPVLNPSEVLASEPKPTEFACVEDWDLPSPIGSVNWRDFPPEGLVEVLPETKTESGWMTGIPYGPGRFAGPQTFSYDGEGRVVTWTAAYGDFDDPTEEQVRTSYTYNDAGNLVEVGQERWLDGLRLGQSRSSYVYLEEGPVSHLEFADWDGAAWDVRRIVDCQHDDAGRLTKRVGETCPERTFFDPNPPCSQDSTLFVYDDLGRITAADRSTKVGESRSGPVWRRVRTRFEYDEAGRLIEAINPRNDPFVETVRFVYHYDSAGRLSAQETSRGFTRRRERYAYQHRGLLTRIADDLWTVVLDGWVEQGETRHEYDADGLLEMTIRYPGSPEYWSRSRYRYDDEHRIAGETYSRWTGTDWEQDLDATYGYDAAGLLLSYTEFSDSDQRGGEFRFLYSYAVGTANSRDLPAATSTRLKQNYPNPVLTRTRIGYTLDQPAAVRLIVFDTLGRTVRRLDAGHQQPGLHSFELDASDLPPGVYLYRLEAGGTIQTGNMVVID